MALRLSQVLEIRGHQHRQAQQERHRQQDHKADVMLYKPQICPCHPLPLAFLPIVNGLRDPRELPSVFMAEEIIDRQICTDIGRGVS